MVSQSFFYVLAPALVLSAVGVVALKNTVHAAFALVAAFGLVAVTYLTLNADFVAMAQILIYAGAIIIMLLFALMLTQRKETALVGGPAGPRFFPGLLVSILLFVAFVRVLATSPWGSRNFSQSVLQDVISSPGGTALVIGKEFFGTFLLPFEVASVLLLMALVGAIVLARRERSQP